MKEEKFLEFHEKVNIKPEINRMLNRQEVKISIYRFIGSKGNMEIDKSKISFSLHKRMEKH